MRPYRWFGLVLAVSLLVLSGCSGGGGGSSTPAVQAPSGLAYSANPASFTLGQAIANDVPSCTGGAPTSFSVTPALPAGLSLGPASGVITGIPGALTARAIYTVTASNQGGSTTAAVAITVNDAAPLEAVDAGCGAVPRDRHFLAALPLASSDLDALADLRILKEGQILASRTSTGAPGPAPMVRRASGEDVAITWDARIHPGLLVRDASTGEVIAVLGGGEGTIRTRAAALDLVVSDGMKGHTTHIKQVD